MLQEFFNYDNPVWRFIGKFFDVFLLNILWLVCSLPIVTMGAATTAVYYATMKLVRDEETSAVRMFFKAFRQNLKQATAIWLILLALGVITGLDFYISVMLPGNSPLRMVMIAVFLGFALVWSGVTLMVFPLQATFYNPVKTTLLNALFLSLRHFPATLGMLVLDLLLPFLALFVIAQLQPVLFLFGFPLIAFLNSFVLVGIFARYMPKEETGREEEGPHEDGRAL